MRAERRLETRLVDTQMRKLDSLTDEIGMSKTDVISP